MDFPNSTLTWITGINSPGDIVGFYQDMQGTLHGFVLHHGTFISDDVPGAISTANIGIDPNHNVVGRYVTPDGRTDGYLLMDLY